MKDRCYNKNHKWYHRYGGRGILVCDRWKNSFANFYADMGERPPGRYSIERIDNNGNYEPSNCKWAHYTEQNKNKKPSKQVLITYEGKTMNQKEWAKELNLSIYKIRKKFKHAISLPVST